MVLEGILMLIGAGATMAAGIPIAIRLARAGFDDAGTTESADFGAGRAASASAGFTSLDLGPDPVQWPSATPWPTSKLPVPEWPSKSWDDEHFGSFWRDGASVAQPSSLPEQAARQESKKLSDAKRDRKINAERDHERWVDQKDEPRRAAARQVLEQRQSAREQRQQQAAHKQQRARQEEQRPRRQQQARTPKPAAPTAAPADGAPSRDELMTLVEEVGLAGTVQQIMKRTGWEFRKAAQYLARVRAGG